MRKGWIPVFKVKVTVRGQILKNDLFEGIEWEGVWRQGWYQLLFQIHVHLSVCESHEI